MSEYKSGPSLVWDENAKYREQKWPELKNSILNTHGGIGIIVDDFIEMLRYRGAPFGPKTDTLREAFAELTLDATSDEDIALLADILDVMMRKPWETNIDGGWYIANLRKKENTDEFDAERASLVINHLYSINAYPAIVLCNTLTNFVESYDKPLVTLWDKMRSTGKLRQEIIMSMKPVTVFISYAREDDTKAEKLRAALQKKEIKVWKDTHEILPGERWENKIKKEMKEHDFVIVCLSKTAVNKTGYFQVELRDALKWVKHRPDSRIYLIPIKFDECELPLDIDEFQFVNMFPDWDEGIEAITKAVLNGRADKGRSR